MPSPTIAFRRYAWGVLGYTLLVILWGAFVRATGAGAGCGSHWPLCNGEVVPRAAEVETLIEFTHRLTSGLAGVLVVILVIWAVVTLPKGHRVRRGAFWSLVFMITEGLIGAGLVLFEWVAYNDSMARVISIALHLNNTFILVAALALTAYWASGGPSFRVRNQGLFGWLLIGGVVGMLVVSTAGAITALGDTLFRVDSLAEGLARDFSPTAHILERLRIWHPVLAVLLGTYLILMAQHILTRRPEKAIVRLGRSIQGVVLVQLGAGVVNVVLLAPVWLQLVHLLLADVLWIVLILFAAATLSVPASGVAWSETPALFASRHRSPQSA